MFGIGGKKNHHPYAKLAIFTLAASGVISAVSRAKRFVKDKAHAMVCMVKGKNGE